MQDTSPLSRIEKVVSWYQNLSRHYNDGETLIHARKRLATAFFDFAMEYGAAGKQMNRSEFERKAAFARAQRKHIGDGKSAAQAKVLAEVEVEALLQEEKSSEAEFRAMGFLYNAAGEVLNTMNQHIANLRQEKRLETIGSGSQG